MSSPLPGRSPIGPQGRLSEGGRVPNTTPWGLWLLTLALVGLGAVGALRLRTDNSPEVFFPRDSVRLAAYQDLLETFGSDRVVRLTLVGPEAFGEEGLAALDRLAQGALSIPGLGLIDPRDWNRSTGPSLREAARVGLAHHLGLVDAAGEGLGLAVELPTSSLGARQQAIERLEALVSSESSTPGFQLLVSGLPILDRALDRSSQEIMALYFPLLIVSSTLLLFIALRRRREVVAALTYVGFCLLVTLGGLSWLGVTLNLVVAILPPVLFAIAMATAVHILVRFRLRHREGQPLRAACRAAVEEKRTAVLWAGATTLVGFASLASAGPGPVRTLGVASAAGIVVLTAAALTLLPALLRFSPGSRTSVGPPKTNPFDVLFGQLGRRAAELAIRHSRWVVVGLFLSGLFAALGWGRLQVESNALNYLAVDHPVRQSIEELEDLGLGSGSLEVMVGTAPCAESERYDRSAGLLELAQASERLRKIPSIKGVAGPAELAALGLETLNRQLGSAAVFAPNLGLQSGLGIVAQDERLGAPVLRRFLTPDGCRARLTVAVGLTGLTEFDLTVENVRRALERVGSANPAAAGPVITGAYPLLLATQRRLLQTFASSALLSLLGIGVLFLALTRHAGRTLLALLPNVWPVVVVIGSMGWFGIPLDIATVMVAAVILGLAVDDTVHTLAGFERLRAQGVAPREAIVRVMERSAPAYVLTSALLASGFGVCAFSDFAPTARFGGLAALAMGFVLVGALVLLPALLGAASAGRGE